MTREVALTDIIAEFPAFRVAAVLAEGLTNARDRDPALDALIAEREAVVRAQWQDHELSQIPGIAAWRAAYRAFGVKQNRYRSAIERLIKNLKAGTPLARVNTLVDLYNIVSATHVLPVAANDIAHVVFPVTFRRARAGDEFVDMSDLSEDGAVEPEAPPPQEIVQADALKLLCRRWNWPQDARSLISPATTQALMTIQSNGVGDVEAAAADLQELVARFCGGQCRVTVLDRDRPRADLA